MLLINFKTYREASGKAAINLARICQEVNKETNISIIPVVQVINLISVKKEVDIPVWIQHVDSQPQGQFTGSINIESVYEAGAAGTLLNHSESPLDFATIEKTMERIKSLGKAFQAVLCVKDLEMLDKVKKLQPDFIAYEPPDLIGSKTSSVALEKAYVIAKAVQAAGNIPLIVGAGIKTIDDVKISLAKGAKGILAASGIVLSQNPKQVLTNFAKEFVK